MEAPDTVVDALRLLRADGYEIAYQLVDGHLECDAAAARCSTTDVVVERVYRFEGPSDPGDEMIVFGLRDPASGAKGHLASGFGSAADPELLEHLTGLASRFGSS